MSLKCMSSFLVLVLGLAMRLQILPHLWSMVTVRAQLHLYGSTAKCHRMWIFRSLDCVELWSCILYRCVRVLFYELILRFYIFLMASGCVVYLNWYEIYFHVVDDKFK